MEGNEVVNGEKAGDEKVEEVHVGNVPDTTTVPAPDFVTTQSFNEGLAALKQELLAAITETFFKPPAEDTYSPGDVGTGIGVPGAVIAEDIPGVISYSDIKW